MKIMLFSGRTAQHVLRISGVTMRERLETDATTPANNIAELVSLESYRVRRITMLQMITPSFTASCKVTRVSRQSKVNALKKWVLFCSI